MNYVDQLSNEHLETWRTINSGLWLYENTDSEDSFHRKVGLYAQKIQFLKGCYNDYSLEKEKEIFVSEVTGNIYYIGEE